MARLAGKKAFITGGASGLGRAMAELFAREGAKVAVADINKAGADAVASAINASLPGHALALAIDVTREADWQSALRLAVNAMGGLSILVNNAGIAASGNVEETDFETWKRVQAVDLDSVYLGCKYALPYLRESQPAAIVNISSIAGLIAGHNMAAYNAAKAGVWLLTKSVALQCARQGQNIRCNSIHPTFIRTPILNPIIGKKDEAEILGKLARQVPLGRIGEPDDVAYAALYLACDESKFVTGAELKVDGGISAM